MILAHRGIWNKIKEQNTMIAFKRAFKSNIGIETDIRDYNGELVISHDIPVGKELLLSDFFREYKNFDSKVCLALNIKSDGLCTKVKSLINKFQIFNYFCFDMSYPDLRDYDKNNLNFYTRTSEFEKELLQYKNCKGVWIDAFETEWYSKYILKKFLKQNKKIAIVSAELHKRDYKSNWEIIKKMNLSINSIYISLCTDHPLEAVDFFKESL